MAINTNDWNRIRYRWAAPLYDRIVRPLAAGRARAVELLALKGGERILIVGCGTGLDLELLPRTAAITAIDLTPEMVSRTRERAKELDLTIDTREMDAAKLDFADSSFDVVLLHLILAVVPDPERTATEAGRVLRPDGRASIFDKFMRSEKPSLARRALNIVTNALATDVTRRAEPLIALAGLRAIHDEPASFGGFFRIITCEKPRI
jgi:ubiquinone/menaquinone biosynthesis C-methylase UbiE